MLLAEPTWGIHIILSRFATMIASPVLTKRVPMLSDIFVFTYPIVLVGIYGYAMVRKWKDGKMEHRQSRHCEELATKQSTIDVTIDYHSSKPQDEAHNPDGSGNSKRQLDGDHAHYSIKSLALGVCFAALTSIIVNIGVQQFFIKDRPYVALSTENVEYIANILESPDTYMCFDTSCNVPKSTIASSVTILQTLRNLATEKTEHQTMLHARLPKTSFPSDHATISFAIAIAMLYAARKIKKSKRRKKPHPKSLSFREGLAHAEIAPLCRRGDGGEVAIFRISGLFFLLFAIIMSIGRIMTAVHWPTDIIAGALLGTSVSLLFFQPSIRPRIEKYLLTPLVAFEESMSHRILERFTPWVLGMLRSLGFTKLPKD